MWFRSIIGDTMKSVDGDGDGDVYGSVVGWGKWRAEKPSLYFRCLEEMLHSGTCPLAGGGAVKEYAATRILLLAELEAYISSYRRTIQTCLHVDLMWVVSPWTQNQGQIDRSTKLPWRSPSLFGAFLCNANSRVFSGGSKNGGKCPPQAETTADVRSRGHISRSLGIGRIVNVPRRVSSL